MNTPKPTAHRRKFDADFKAEALKMVAEGRSASAVARSFNVSEKLLYRWKYQQNNQVGKAKLSRSMNSNDWNVSPVKAQLKRVEMERDI